MLRESRAPHHPCLPDGSGKILPDNQTTRRGDAPAKAENKAEGPSALSSKALPDLHHLLNLVRVKTANDCAAFFLSRSYSVAWTCEDSPTWLGFFKVPLSNYLHWAKATKSKSVHERCVSHTRVVQRTTHLDTTDFPTALRSTLAWLTGSAALTD